ncbi:myotubularin-related protein 2, putative, partial [Ichthyophthirius multifiliis]
KLQLQYQQQKQYLFKFLDNENGELCNSYPNLIVVPKRLKDEEITSIKQFRSRQRIPVLSYGFKNTKKNNQITTLWRCAQCLSGILSRNLQDEQLFKYIGQTSKQNINVHIYDARPQINALVNRVQGKGYENTDYYDNCQLIFLGIHNIHKMRYSYIEMQKATREIDQKQYLINIQLTSWLEHIQGIFSGINRIVNSLIQGINVVVHCSDGWDRTAQLVSLSQILIDPYYRTIKGFQSLVDKEWICFGHQFFHRLGHGQKNIEGEFSPIFIQFLDCVHQIILQFPLSFEFNQIFLVDIAFHLYSCKFGNFLCNNYQQMKYNQVFEETDSLWVFLNNQKEKYLNPFYLNGVIDDILIVDISINNFKVWEQYFFCYHKELLDKYNIFQDKCKFNQQIFNLFIFIFNKRDNIYELHTQQIQQNQRLSKEIMQKNKQLEDFERMKKQNKELIEIVKIYENILDQQNLNFNDIQKYKSELEKFANKIKQNQLQEEYEIIEKKQ